ncbi:hypothetical protein FD755_007153 [Muntiacus reevesi]|uniref:PCI domain-containing protein n=1 Tax=Muntiacus reevesi TaxID=9886 RepID=A0A5J5MGS5_MUNRE|nr:hypothetical protein FD755_007153 [Muntiacus reevesi]
MNVPVFIDINKEDQVAELLAYLKSKGAEISEENCEGGLHVGLAQIIEACNVCLKEDDKQEALIQSLCEKLVRFQEGERPSLRLQLLSNLFHGMDENTPVRYTVSLKWQPLVGSSSIFQMSWINDAASKVLVELLGSYLEDNASQARADAHRCIVQSLKDPNAFLSDHLLTLKPVKFLEGELMHDLLTIFVSAKLASYNTAKMRLLTFMGMAVENKEISFDRMQQELQIGAEDVEAFVIHVVRTKMIYYKIDQTQRKVVVSHSTLRTFGKQQWQQLYDTVP